MYRKSVPKDRHGARAPRAFRPRGVNPSAFGSAPAASTPPSGGRSVPADSAGPRRADPLVGLDVGDLCGSAMDAFGADD